MRLKLSFKLFGAFCLIFAIVVGAMFLAGYIFSHTFKSYIQQMEMGRLERLVPVLQEEYRTHGNWEGLRADSPRWRRLVRIVNMREFPPPPHFEGDRPPKEIPPPGGPPGILLMDAGHHPVIGGPVPKGQQQLVAIEVDGHTVGWLGLREHEPFKSGPPAALLERQAKQLSLGSRGNRVYRSHCLSVLAASS